jgi:hypothetical protein
MSAREFFKKYLSLDFLTDRVAMIAAIIVSLGTITLMFVVITPDILIFQIVMGSMGAILVLFSPRALAKRKFGLWRWIACLIVFAEVSTVLTMTDTRSQEATTTEAVTVDPVWKAYQDATKTAQDNLTDLIGQQHAATTKDFLETLKGQIAIATVIYQTAFAAQASYRSAGPAQVGIDPNKLFMAIPSAIASGQLARYMTLVFSIIVAIVFQAVIFATVTNTVKQIRRADSEKAGAKKPKKPRKPPKPKPAEAEQEEPKPITEDDFIQETEPPSMLDV